MMNWKLNTLALAGLLFAATAHAEGLSWNYTQLSYQTTDDQDVEGLSGKMSARISGNWILQGGISYSEDDGRNSRVLSQTRYDLSVARLFPLTENMAAFVSAGYTHVSYRERLIGGNDTVGFDAASLNGGFRGRWGRFEADAQVGVLADEDDVSDLLYELGARYHFTDNVAVNLAIIGSEDSTSFDEMLYELGVRFDLEG